MKLALIPAALLFAAAPLSAQIADEPYADDPWAVEQDALPPGAATDDDIWNDDPYAEQDEAVLAVDRFVGTLLDMPIGGLAGALPGMEIDEEVRPGDTLRDVGERRDPDFERNLRSQARAMTGVIGHMMRRLSAATPALEDWAERMGDAARD